MLSEQTRVRDRREAQGAVRIAPQTAPRDTYGRTIGVTVALSWAALLLGACFPQPGIPVVGVPGDLSQLVGRWAGEYSSAVTGREGTIHFELTEATDTAHGHVTMIPRGGTSGFQAVEYEGVDPHFFASTELLHVDFVQVRQGELRGQLSPYRDPECGCVLLTVFEGTIVDDVIEGVYYSVVAETGDEASGRWRVVRDR